MAPTLTMRLPTDLQNSYLNFKTYPENLRPSSTAIYRSKLVAYRKRLDEAKSDLCLINEEDDVDATFEIPIIDLETGDGKGLFSFLV